MHSKKSNIREIIRTLKEIYEELEKRKLLYFKDLNGDFYRTIDASEYAICVILYQKWRNISHFIKTLSYTQRKHPIFEKKSWENKQACEKWYSWIGGFKIIVFTGKKNISRNTVKFI